MTASPSAARPPNCADISAIVAKPAVTIIELMAALGRKVKPHESTHQIFNATGIGRVSVKDLTRLVFDEYAGAHHIFAALEWDRSVIERGCAGD
jgi:hypothetical protein